MSPVVRSLRLVFPAKQQVHTTLEDLPPLQAGEVLVRTQFSLMSTGTENIVFNRLFDPGTHWDKWVQYPFYPGYSAVGIVEASESPAFKPGDRVAARAKHQSRFVKPGDDCYPIPANLPFEQALWFALAKIAWHGARAADYKLGDSVLIIGAGPIGQMSIRWARAAGATSILVVDAAPERMALATAGGASTVIPLPVDQARDAILAANGNRLPRVVIDTTGNAEVFTAALGLADQYGKVVILGDTGRPASQTLSSDVITRGISIVGVHDGHNTAEWNGASISRVFFALASTGRFPLEGLNTHHFQPEDCAKAYETANRERTRTMGIVFDWSKDCEVAL